MALFQDRADRGAGRTEAQTSGQDGLARFVGCTKPAAGRSSQAYCRRCGALMTAKSAEQRTFTSCSADYPDRGEAAADLAPKGKEKKKKKNAFGLKEAVGRMDWFGSVEATRRKICCRTNRTVGLVRPDSGP